MSSENHYQLDDIDRQLLVLMTEDASQTNVALARQLGVSDNTVRNRIHRLIEEGVMQVVAIVDPWLVGQRIQIVSGIQVDLGRVHDIVEELAGLPEVTYVSYTTGEYDIIMVAVLADQEALFEFLTERIPSIEGITRLQSNQVLKAVKRTFQYHELLKQAGKVSESQADPGPDTAAVGDGQVNTG